MDTINLKDGDISQIVYEAVNAKAASAENKGKRAPDSYAKKSENYGIGYRR